MRNLNGNPSKVRRLAVFSIALAIFAAVGLAAVAVEPSNHRSLDTPQAPTIATLSPDVAEKIGSAVVTIVNLQVAGGPEGSSSSDLVPGGTGSGFIIDRRGRIVTNDHVIEGGQKFEVIYSDGTHFSAKLLGGDPFTDVAVLQVGGPVPAVAPLGDSDTLRHGQTVLAIGSPLGLTFTNTVTQGIVSA